VCDGARAFASIAGAKTLSLHTLEKIMFLGYEIKYQLPRHHLFTLAELGDCHVQNSFVLGD
jgi:hypothetical protein